MPRYRKMTWSEKNARLSARNTAVSCRIWLAHALGHQAEANQWHAIEGAEGGGADSLAREWETRADQAQATAVAYAVKAAHYAGRALAEATPVVCTGCGARTTDTATWWYGDHADTYSGTLWHCPACAAVCQATPEAPAVD